MEGICLSDTLVFELVQLLGAGVGLVGGRRTVFVMLVHSFAVQNDSVFLGVVLSTFRRCTRRSLPYSLQYMVGPDWRKWLAPDSLSVLQPRLSVVTDRAEGHWIGTRLSVGAPITTARYLAFARWRGGQRLIRHPTVCRCRS